MTITIVTHTTAAGYAYAAIPPTAAELARVAETAPRLAFAACTAAPQTVAQARAGAVGAQRLGLVGRTAEREAGEVAA